MMHLKFDTHSVTKQFETLLNRVEKVDIDAVVDETLEAVRKVALEEMKSRVAPHASKKKRAYNAVKSSGIKRNGNYHSVEIGAYDIRGEDKDGFHIIYQEYGSPGHTTKNGKLSGYFKADPWLRPSLEKAKRMLNKTVKDILQRWCDRVNKAA